MSMMITPSAVPIQQVPASLQPSPVNHPTIVNNFAAYYSAFDPLATHLLTSPAPAQPVQDGGSAGGGGGRQFQFGPPDRIPRPYGIDGGEGPTPQDQPVPVIPQTATAQPMGPPTPNSQGPWQSGGNATNTTWGTLGGSGQDPATTSVSGTILPPNYNSGGGGDMGGGE